VRALQHAPSRRGRPDRGCRADLPGRRTGIPVTLVTGAASGIGQAICARLTGEGWDVVGVDVDDGDLTTREGNRAVVELALSRHGRLDAVVPNAGFQHVAPVAEFPEDRWDALLAVLLTSPFLLARYAWEALRASGDGRIVVVASAHALVASPYKAAYVAAKHGALGLVKTLALEGAEDGILASAVCPGFVRTPLVEQQIPAQAERHGVSEDRALEEVILAPHAVKRLIEPDEVAGAVAFLLGPGGRAFSGAALPMDLGWTAR
jgi:3-hydroxybutyrate dehydrogenase